MKRVITTVIGLLLACGVGLDSRGFQTSDAATELAKAKELTDQVVNLINERRYDQALPLAQQVVEIRQRLLPSDDAQVGFALTYLAELYLVKKKEQDAEKTFQRALAIYESHPEQNQPAIGKTLERLSYIRFLKRDYKSAEPLAWRSVLTWEKLLGRADSKTITAMKNYACIALMADTTKGPSDGREPDQNKATLRAVSLCWLGGLTDKCNEEAKVQANDLVNRRAEKLEFPAYPAGARQKHLTGRTFVAVLLNDQGEVIDAKPVCGGDQDLNAASLAAARKSKFNPLDSVGKQVTGIIVYRFLMQ